MDNGDDTFFFFLEVTRGVAFGADAFAAASAASWMSLRALDFDTARGGESGKFKPVALGPFKLTTAAS